MSQDKIAFNKTSLTKQVLDSIVEQLSYHVGEQLAVEFYPEQPTNYRLNHANGALLVNYGKSDYGRREDVRAVIKERTSVFTITVISRNLHDKYGAVPLVDWVIAMLSGFTASHCDKPFAPIDDYFVQHQSGLWFYAVDISTQAVHVQTKQIHEI